jgi:AraC family transcriptional regulator
MNRTPSGKETLGVVLMQEPSIKQVEAQTVAFKVMRGAYAQTPEGLGELYGWIGQQGLRPTGMPQAVYFTMPDSTPEAEAIWELWAPIEPGTAEAEPDQRDIGIRQIEAQTVASIMHKGPYDQVGPAYERLFAWIPMQGRQVCGPPRELYLNDPGEAAPEEYLTEIQVPVTT